jgi:hypothetical protein
MEKERDNSFLENHQKNTDFVFHGPQRDEAILLNQEMETLIHQLNPTELMTFISQG